MLTCISKCVGTTTVGLLWYCEIGRQYLLFFNLLFFYRIELAYLNSNEISICLMFMKKCFKCLFGIMTTSTYKCCFVVCILQIRRNFLLFTKKFKLISEGHI